MATLQSDQAEALKGLQSLMSLQGRREHLQYLITSKRGEIDALNRKMPMGPIIRGSQAEARQSDLKKQIADLEGQIAGHKSDLTNLGTT